MKHPLTRREMIRGSVATAALALGQVPLAAFGVVPGPEGKVIPFLEGQAIDPKRPMLNWQELTSWITPNEKLFAVNHYGLPAPLADPWRLEITGLVKRPKTFSLEEIKRHHPRQITATLECSGNSSSIAFLGAIGNLRWTGVPLSSLLKECGLADRALEIVFFGADQKTEKIREKDYVQNFARSLARNDALREEVLVAYEMNGEPLPREHGGPLRLVVPGWFGIAWVKWLNRIEALDRRYMSKYMAREYVTIRGEEKDGQTVWRETSVGPIDLKSIVARVVQSPNGRLRISGAAWSDGTPVRSVQLKIDDGPWIEAALDRHPRARYSWVFWNYDWPNAPAGEHTLVSRAVSLDGTVQPAASDPAIALKRTYWEANQQYPRRIRI